MGEGNLATAAASALAAAAVKAKVKFVIYDPPLLYPSLPSFHVVSHSKFLLHFLCSIWPQ